VNELEMIAKRLAGLLVKRPGIAVGLWGSPGIGKTFTARGLLRETPCGNLSLHATTSPSSLALALPRPKKLPAWVERGLEKLESGEFVERATITDALGAILAGIAPFIVHLEDIHEVAPEQLEFVQSLARGVVRLRGVGLIVTSRHEPPEPFEAVRLEPLTADETARMLEAEVGASLPPEALAWIQARAAGNPLYTLEFFRHLARQGFVWNDGRHWRWRAPERETMPATVEALLENALRAATDAPELEAAISARSMLGAGADAAIWAAVSGLTLEDVGRARTTLEARGIMRGLEFAHPLYREVTRNGLPAERRREFARRAIGMHTGEPESAITFLEDAALEPEHALELLRRAADVLFARGDAVRASACLARAVDHAPIDARPALALEAAQQVRHVNLPEAMRLAELARDDPRSRAEAVHVIAELLAIQGRGQEAERALETLPDRGSRTWWWRLMQVRGLAQNDAGVLEVLYQHSDVLEDADTATLARVARTLANHGQADRAESLVAGALEAPDLEEGGRVLLLKARSMIAYARSDFAHMEALEREVLELAQGLGNLRWVDAAHFNRALALEALGDHVGRMRALESAMQTCVELGDATALAIAQSAYGSALHASALYERAEGMLLEAHAILCGLDVGVYLVDCESGLSRLYLDWQPPHGSLLAHKYAHAALEHARSLQIERSVVAGECLTATLEARTGHGQRALERTVQALEPARRMALPSVLADALQAHGHALEAVGDAQGAVLSWRESEVISRETGDLTNAHLAGLEADRIANDAASAFDRHAWFEERGLMNGANIARRYFPQLSANQPAHTPEPLETKTTLRLEALGIMQFSLQGKPEPVRGRKRQELLVLLLEARIAGRTEVGKLELLDALYPDSAEDQAGNSLKETVRTTRSNLGADVIQTTQTGYALGAVTSDAEDFLKSGRTSLWRGAYLDGLTLETRDDTVRESLHLALFTAAMTTLETDAREAARVGRILLDFDGYNLDYLELCVRALRGSSNHKSLTRLYAEARERLLEVGEIIPERWQDFLERTLLKA
jgi:tetratricopeptide (TPR) repeat protein